MSGPLEYMRQQNKRTREIIRRAGWSEEASAPESNYLSPTERRARARRLRLAQAARYRKGK